MKIGSGVGTTTSLITTQTAAVLSGGAGFTIDNAVFDGGDELQRAAPGVFPSDGKEFSFSFWFKLTDVDDQTQVIFSAVTSGNRFLLQRSASGGAQDNNFAVVGRNTSNSLILYIESLLNSNGQFDSSSRNPGWNHFLMSGNLATSTFHMYANGVNILDTGATFLLNQNIDFTGLFHVGGIGGSARFYGDMAEFWLDDSFIDFSSSTNREKFRSSGGAAVDLGSDGSTPTGSSPLVYLHLDAGETGNNFALNAGTGGDFTVSAGAITTTGDTPST